MNKKILVVDDDRTILDAIKFALEFSGYEVKTTEKGEYAENLKDGNGGLPALIILDVLLSGKDGRMICKKLKNQASTKHIPIIMISAHPDADKALEAIGANDFLAKPFEVDALLQKVKKYI